MAFADPQTVTISAVPYTLPRVSSGDNVSSYKTNDGVLTMTFSHFYGKRNRHVSKLTVTNLVADPLTPANFIPVSTSFTLTADVPLVGIAVAYQKADLEGFLALLTASSGAALTKILGGES